MTDTELLINTLVIAFVVGVMVGAVLVDVLFAEPARRHRDALLAADARRRRLAAQDEISRTEWRREHLGTPYIRDHNNHSRKASSLEVVK